MALVANIWHFSIFIDNLLMLAIAIFVNLRNILLCDAGVNKKMWHQRYITHTYSMFIQHKHPVVIMGYVWQTHFNVITRTFIR